MSSPVPPLSGLLATSDAQNDRQFSMNLARGLDVLRAFTAEQPVLGNRDISERTGLPKATVSRLTYTLTLLGYLSRVEALQKFRLGAGVLSLSYPLMASLTTRQVARPIMHRLASETGCTVNLGMRDRLSVVYVECVRLTVNAHYPEIGATRPLMTTAIGRALIGASPPDEREAILNRLKVHDPQRYAADLPLWLRDAKLLATRGYCHSRGDWQRDLIAVGAPIRQPARHERLAINCTIHAHRLEGAEPLEKRVVPLMLEAAREIEIACGLS